MNTNGNAKTLAEEDKELLAQICEGFVVLADVVKRSGEMEGWESQQNVALRKALETVSISDLKAAHVASHTAEVLHLFLILALHDKGVTVTHES